MELTKFHSLRQNLPERNKQIANWIARLVYFDIDYNET